MKSPTVSICSCYELRNSISEIKTSQRVMQRLGMTYKGIEQHYDVPCVVYEWAIKEIRTQNPINNHS
ncbi:hypothetical protein PRCB_02875 [Pantoea rodasii]|uniref:Uncharacterized protein n=1 Tax=Pantoea rodasii TaxID=1076549 RepID=A0A2M9WHF6_9GAMM|nr:hypothetical protein PRCB_02875 [Pantoea rodasii]